MPTYTDNHEFNLYEDDEVPWEHRSDFRKIDTRLEIRDTNSNRALYTPKTGAVFRATDTGSLYFGNGSSWVLASLGVDSLSTSSVNGGGPISGGDGTERQIWVIDAGASDPAGASAEDIIFEREV